MIPDSTYLAAYTAAAPNPEKNLELLTLIAKIRSFQYAYARVSLTTGIPWLAVATIHYRESALRFDCHLHNGDPLTAKTVHVPKGRPVSGLAPYSWEDSASDALSSAWRPPAWSVAAALQFTERYNGMGYWKRGAASPYVWSWTSRYTAGLFQADGVFNPVAQDAEAGTAAIFKAYAEVVGSLPFPG